MYENIFENITETRLKNKMTPVVFDNNFIRTMETDNNIDRNISMQMATLDIYQKNLILYLIAEAKRNKDEFKIYKMTFVQFLELTECSKGGKTYEDVFNSLDKLAKMTFIIHPTPNSSLYKRWLSDDTLIDFDKKIIKVCLAPGLKEFVSNLKSNYTSFLAGFALSFRCKYSFRLYTYLRSLLNKMKVNISVKDFANHIASNTYVKNNHLIKYVIEPSLKEINQYSDIKVEYNVQKNNKGGIFYTFFLTDKTIEEKRQLLCQWGFSNKQVYAGYFDKILKNPYWVSIFIKNDNGKFEAVMIPKKQYKPDPNFQDPEFPMDVN